MLLGLEEVNPDKPNIDGDTQLLNATWLEQGGVVKILLGLEEVCPDRPGHYGLTPLTYAAWVGRDDDNSDMPGCDGRTPLSYAAEEGHVEMGDILLRPDDVSPDRADNTDGTPLALKDRKEWRKYYSDETRSTPTKRIMTAKHHSCVQLSMAIRM